MHRDLTRDEENLVFVVRATNIIESKMKKVISAFIGAPASRSSFVESYLLNNSTVSLGAKIKLLSFIAKDLGISIDRQAMHALVSRRNAFAHQDHLNSIRVVTESDGHPNVSFVVESIKGSGELETITQGQALSQFVDAYSIVESDLDNLLTCFASSK